MTRVGVVAFSKKGKALACSLMRKLREAGCAAEGFIPQRHAAEGSMPQERSAEESTSQFSAAEELIPFHDLGALTGKLFAEKEILIFVGACGIAVRAIAPYVRSKLHDPGVLVVDECGTYVISLLSGHIGRANEYAKTVASLLGAQPVITTATDRSGLFAVDDWAAENGLRVMTPERIREISSRILAGERVGFYSAFPVAGSMPEELTGGEAQTGIVVSDRPASDRFPVTCRLLPMDLVVGIGCKKGKSVSELQAFLKQVFMTYGLDMERIGKITSISLKAQEEGLILLARALHVPFVTYSAEELETAVGSFAESDFVRQKTGVSNVCERSACLGSGGGKRLVAKQSENGMTIAVYERKLSLTF